MRCCTITLLFFGFFLSGCASLSKDECLSANWKEIGFRDGTKGYSSSNQIASHRQACKEHGIGVDSQQYHSGHDAGIKQFCRPTNGRAQGEAGYSYRGVCPPEMETAFLRQYEYGSELREARKELDKVKGDIKQKEDQLRIEKNAVIREALRSEIGALDDLYRTLQRSYNRLRDNPPR